MILLYVNNIQKKRGMSLFFLIFSIIILNLIVIISPKQLSLQEMYATSLFTAVLQLITDVFLDLGYDLYGYFGKGVDSLALIVIFGVYPAINILFLNFYPYKKSFVGKCIYILCWSVFSVFYEWLSIKSGYFYHNGWNYWYSALCYPILFGILILNLYVFRKMNHSN